MGNFWQIRAVKYADRNARTRADSFLNDDHPTAPHGMDYFVWVLDNGERQILVDTGYDFAEAKRRGRPILRDPAKAIEAAGMNAETASDVIISHLHYDHAGGLDRYPQARFHLQDSEMSYATGRCMCDHDHNHPFTPDHVCEMVRHVYSGRVEFHDGDAQVAPGVTVHRIGGHSMGLQAVRVETSSGPVCLASDAAHYYENFETGKLFPIVPFKEDMIRGFHLIQDLAGNPSRVVPGHDPLVRERYEEDGNSGFVWRIA